MALRTPAPPYAELHCHSTFSFLDGASLPEELALQAAELGLEALALTDHDNLCGALVFAQAAQPGTVAAQEGACQLDTEPFGAEGVAQAASSCEGRLAILVDERALARTPREHDQARRVLAQERERQLR
jgi:error-prone DNA polymerase